MVILQLGSSGPEVTDLQDKLRARGFDPGSSDGSFGPGTAAAVAAFQRGAGLTADGVVGPRTASALGLAVPVPPVSLIPAVTVEIVRRMFPNTPEQNIQQNLPVVLNALVAAQLAFKAMILMALGAIPAEVETFLPSARVNRFSIRPRADNHSTCTTTGPTSETRVRRMAHGSRGADSSNSPGAPTTRRTAMP